MNGYLTFCVILGCIFVVVLQFLLSPVEDLSETALTADQPGKADTRQPKRRVKRYLNLPEGASVQLVYCFLMTILGSNQQLTFGISLGIAYEVPSNIGNILAGTRTQHRRDKRSLYPKIAVFIDKYQKGEAYEPVDKYDTAHSQENCSQYMDVCPITIFLPKPPFG
ncbi:uncharacterized protein [Bemisia tabaci]|uniref:uncharacterized protein isoform X3 n=1 Tax=Bemisia tabaci TaxID=7038 RepID=UPI003B27B652